MRIFYFIPDPYNGQEKKRTNKQTNIKELG